MASFVLVPGAGGMAWLSSLAVLARGRTFPYASSLEPTIASSHFPSKEKSPAPDSMRRCTLFVGAILSRFRTPTTSPRASSRLSTRCRHVPSRRARPSCRSWSRTRMASNAHPANKARVLDPAAPRRTTASRCSSIAFSSSASTCAASANPPAEAMSFATASTLARCGPVRNTLAPSRSKALATAPPIPPPGSVDHSNLVLEHHDGILSFPGDATPRPRARVVASRGAFCFLLGCPFPVVIRLRRLSLT